MSTPNNAETEDASLEKIPTLSSLTAEPLGPSGDAPPPDAAHLWEEANKAIGDLLAVKSSLDAHWQKLISEFGMALCENDSEAMESIKEAKAICAHSIQEAEDCCAVGQKSGGPPRLFPLNSHIIKLFSTLKRNLLKSQLNFLSICQTSLQASPPKFHGMLVASYHVLLGHAPTSHLFSIPC